MEGETSKNESGVNPVNNEIMGMKSIIDQLESILDEYMVTKAPFALPSGFKGFLVAINPYIIILVAIFALPAILLAFGFASIMAPFGMMGGYGYAWGFSGMVTFAVTVVSLVLELMAVPGLFKRTKASWRLLFYVSIIQIFSNVLSFHIVSAFIGTIISWYILFQLKERYTH